MTDLTTLIRELLARLFRDPEAARQFAQDPQGTLAARGISDHDLGAVNLPVVVEQVSATEPLPQHTRHELHEWAAHETAHHVPYGHAQPLEHLISQVTRVQEIVHNENYHYENHYDDSVHTTIDNSIDVKGDGNVVDPETITAIGDHPLVVGGDAKGPIADGPGAVAVDGTVKAPINTGDHGIASQGNTGVVSTGTNYGNQAGHDVNQGTTTVKTGDLSDSTLHFGSGSDTTTDLSGAHFGQGATIGAGSGSTHGGHVTEDSGNTTTSDSGNETHVDSHDHYTTDSHDHTNSDNETDSHDHHQSHYSSDSHDHTDTHVDSHDDVDVH